MFYFAFGLLMCKCFILFFIGIFGIFGILGLFVVVIIVSELYM